MSSFEPSRIPAWLAPVCDERSVSHSVSACEPSASQRAMFGALPSRIARRRTGSASPSISRKTIPGTSVATRSPERFAIRWIDAQRVRVVVVRAEDDLEDDARRRRRRAPRAAPHQNESTWIAPSVMPSAASSITASSDEHEQEAERRA